MGVVRLLTEKLNELLHDPACSERKLSHCGKEGFKIIAVIFTMMEKRK